MTAGTRRRKLINLDYNGREPRFFTDKQQVDHNLRVMYRQVTSGYIVVMNLQKNPNMASESCQIKTDKNFVT